MKTSTLDNSTLSILDIIKTLIICDLHELIYSDNEQNQKIFEQSSAYIKFIPIITCFEFLGACYDELPFDTSRLNKEDIVETRFNIALKKLFADQGNEKSLLGFICIHSIATFFSRKGEIKFSAISFNCPDCE